MSLRGYWNVIFDRADMALGCRWTIKHPSPGAEDEGGKGEVIMLGWSALLSCSEGLH